MRWAIRVARVSGIDIEIHLSFLLALGLGAMQWGNHHGARGALFGLALTGLLFACVLLHELGHSLVAQRFGLGVQKIILLPIGGLAMMSGKPKRPLHELLIALAGPAVNVALAGLLLAVTLPLYGSETIAAAARAGASELAPSASTALLWLLAANVSLAAFNLIPAFPLDGGRVLRAAMAMLTTPERATRLAAGLGQMIAVALGFVAFFSGQVMLGLVAAFIFFGAGRERSAEQNGSVLAGTPAGLAYNRTALTLGSGERLSRVVEHILTSYQSDFAVMFGDRLLGVVTRDEVTRALLQEAGDPYLSGIMTREVARVEAHESLEEVSRVMAERGVRVVAIEEEGRYLGLVSREDIEEALLYLHLLRHRAARPGGDASGVHEPA